VLNALIESGHRLGLPSVAVTFDPHPVAVLRPESAPELIAPGEIRDDLIEDTGIDGLLVMDFTQEFAKQQPEDFVRAVFVRALSARCVVVGMDTRFGYRNSGDVSTLADLGEKFGFEVVTLDDVGDGERFSSTVVRTHLRAGEVAEAARRSSAVRTGSWARSSTATTGAGGSATRRRTCPRTRSAYVPAGGRVCRVAHPPRPLARGARPHGCLRRSASARTRPSRPRTGARSRPTCSTATTSTSTTSASWSSSSSPHPPHTALRQRR
jgi:hypothetical protein